MLTGSLRLLRNIPVWSGPCEPGLSVAVDHCVLQRRAGSTGSNAKLLPQLTGWARGPTGLNPSLDCGDVLGRLVLLRRLGIANADHEAPGCLLHWSRYPYQPDTLLVYSAYLVHTGRSRAQFVNLAQNSSRAPRTSGTAGCQVPRSMYGSTDSATQVSYSAKSACASSKASTALPRGNGASRHARTAASKLLIVIGTRT